MVKFVEFDVGKRNKPTVYITEDDLERYGERLKKLLLRPTYDKSTNNEKYPFINGVMMVSTYFVECRGTALYTLDYLENFEDPVWILSTNERISYITPGVIEQRGPNLLAWFGDKAPKLVSLPKVPKNAWLISAHNPTWIQVCKHGFLITSGVLWCNEKIEDSGGIIENFGVFREGDKWFVMLPPIQLCNCRMEGLYVAEKNRFIPESVYEKARPETVFKSGVHWVDYRNGKYNEADTFSKIPKEDLEMVKVEFGKHVYYVPRRRLYTFRYIGRLLEEVL